jgi:flagellar hook-length control protein FliK
MQLSTPVASPGWSDGLGDRVAWMVQQDLGQAHLKLNPPQLGPVEVRVQISGDQAQISFTAHNQQARDALEGASQRLRDLLGAQGFVNVQVDVSQHAFHERPQLLQPYDDAEPTRRAALPRPTSPGPVVASRALLDAYA